MTSRHLSRLLAALALLAGLPGAHAEEHDVCAAAAACRAASAGELEALRGGFEIDTPGGRLHLHLGIRREVSVNDQVVAASEVLGSPLIVRNGPGNSVPALSSFAAGAMPLIVQNTLDNQKLGTVTIIDASVNSLSVLNAMRTGEAMSRATAASGR